MKMNTAPSPTRTIWAYVSHLVMCLLLLCIMGCKREETKTPSTATMKFTDYFAFTSPLIDLPHHDGGFLRISESEILVHLSVTVVQSGRSSQQCDILKITKRLADEDKQVHEFVTHISTYDLWDCISDGITHPEESFTQSRHFQEGYERISLATDLYVWSDLGDRRLMGIQTAPTGPPHLFNMSERYFNAKVDLFIVRKPPRNNRTFSDDIVARIVPVQSFTDSTGTFLLKPGTPLMVRLPSALLLFRNNLRYTEAYAGEGLTWNPSVIPLPIEAKRLEKTADTLHPQKGVVWIK